MSHLAESAHTIGSHKNDQVYDFTQHKIGNK